VTASNVHEYARLLERARLREARKQILAIRRGLVQIVPEAFLNLLTWQDLEARVSGQPFIDIALLKRHTQYSQIEATSPVVLHFWEVLNEFDQKMRRKFVRFAWAQERLPADDAEFARSGTRMLIKPYQGSSNPDNAFIKADTCFFNVSIPNYSSKAVLLRQMLIAIEMDSDSMNADEPLAVDDEDQFDFTDDEEYYSDY